MSFEHHDADGMLISCGDAQAELAYLRERNGELSLKAGALPHFEQLAEDATAALRAVRAEVAELTQQRDQAVAALANARKTIAHELVAEGERIREAGHFAAAKAFGGAALFVMGDEALAVPVPAGDTSHDEAPTTTLDGIVICPAWHYVKAYASGGHPFANPEQCALHEPHTVHQDRAGGSDGQWFTRGESQYALPLNAALVVADGGQDETQPDERPDIHDAIEAWHNGDGYGTELHEYLGFLWEDYARWAETGVLPKGCRYSDRKGAPAVVPGGGDTA